MGTGSHAEVERKYDVGGDATTPALRKLPYVAEVSPPAEQELDAVYYDTANLALVRAGITLRRRTGGEDAGWHLKLPVSGDEREEVRLPLSAGTDVPPGPLLDRVRVHVRDHAVVAVARIRTRRIVSRLLDDQGEVLAEFCDDHVSAEGLLPDAPSLAWREWEVELVDGTASLLDDVAILLTQAGVSPSAGPSKLSRVLGESGREPDTGSHAGSRKVTAGQALLSYLKGELVQLQRQDPLVREDAANSVHEMRVAARRLRSALATYRPMLKRGSGAILRDELSWLGGVLGQARDTEVMRGRIHALVGEEPDERALGRVVRRIDREMDSRYESGITNARKALDSARYFRLLDSLEAFVTAPPFTPAVARRASREIPALLKHDWRRVRDLVPAVERSPTRHGRDLALHEVRKAAKRLRYAAESAVPVLGKRADRLATVCETIQDVLGQHHDTVVTREMLRALGDEAHLAGENGPTFGRLQALEELNAHQLEERYHALLRKLPRRKFGRWLRG